jgi:putative radical SAM enzyme (TIGR03279 family)
VSVLISGITKGSYAEKVGISEGDLLLELNGNKIVDVLDYRFYQNDCKVKVKVLKQNGKSKTYTIKKQEYDELGLEFETYLMDKQHSCKNKCVFCFIDQLPKGMRDSLYFKDDDSRLSFLFGNYITLTNITEHEVDRIIKMHISPVNVSVHTTNPELRVKMMKNRFAGQSLDVLWRICEAGIDINCQLVLCPGWNDGDELVRSLNDLICHSAIKSIACVPVGLTRYRDGLEKIEAFNKETAEKVVYITEEFGAKTEALYGERRVFAADEFYLLAEQPVPSEQFYGDFSQLENGVGMWAMMKAECEEALEDIDGPQQNRKITCITGEAAYPLISNIVDNAKAKWHNLECKVYAIKNNFFGGKITVAGLVTGTDIINSLKGKELGQELLVPSVMLRHERDMFLDSVTIKELEQQLDIKVRIVENDGFSFVSALAGEL